MPGTGPSRSHALNSRRLPTAARARIAAALATRLQASGRALRSATRGGDDDGEIILDREIEQFVGDFQRPSLEQAVVPQLQQQIAGLATAHRPPDGSIVLFEQIGDRLRRDIRSPSGGTST